MLDVVKILASKGQKKLSVVTCYDAWTARLIDETDIDLVLVGDSVAMVVHGHDTTLSATPEMMALHVAAVARGSKKKFIVGDMPFLSFRKGPVAALECVDRLMKAGAHSVKLEGVDGHEETVRAIVESGVPVMGHLGLTPQSVHQLGGYRVQGRNQEVADHIRAQAKKLQELGCFSLVLECVPNELAAQITADLRIPTIGIGAGARCDGQVLVLQDLLGSNSVFRPKFVRTFLDSETLIKKALGEFHAAVTSGHFPSPAESYQ